MAYGYANLGADELADLARDMPLLGTNVMSRSPTRVRWNLAGTHAGVDATESGYPVSRIYDADPELVTYPDAANNPWFINVAFASPVAIDHIAIGPGHNLGTSALTVLDLSLDQNQDGIFTATHKCKLAASYPMSSDNRLVQLSLKPYGAITAYADSGDPPVEVTSNAHGLKNGNEIVIADSTNYNNTWIVANVAANTFDLTGAAWAGDDGASTWIMSTAQRFSDVTYCRIGMAKAGAFTPQVTEIVFGARYQLPAWPEMPFNPDNIGNLGETSGPTKGGGIDKYLTAENQFMLDANWILRNSETTALKAWWKKVRGSFVWIWEPSTAPQSFQMMATDEERLELPFIDYMQNTFHIAGTEQGPESKYLENQ